MSWGYRILIFYLLFVTGIVFLVIKSSGQHQDLVTTDYYEQELKFQDKIDQVRRANELSSPIQYEINKETISILFPTEMRDKPITATVMLYCTTDESKDVKKSFNISKGQILFPIPPANKGLHELKITWNANGISYYFGQKISIP